MILTPASRVLAVRLASCTTSIAIHWWTKLNFPHFCHCSVLILRPSSSSRNVVEVCAPYSGKRTEKYSWRALSVGHAHKFRCFSAVRIFICVRIIDTELYSVIIIAAKTIEHNKKQMNESGCILTRLSLRYLLFKLLRQVFSLCNCTLFASSSKFCLRLRRGGSLIFQFNAWDVLLSIIVGF